jgi:hypothetical protein
VVVVVRVLFGGGDVAAVERPDAAATAGKGVSAPSIRGTRMVVPVSHEYGGLLGPPLEGRCAQAGAGPHLQSGIGRLTLSAPPIHSPRRYLRASRLGRRSDAPRRT